MMTIDKANEGVMLYYSTNLLNAIEFMEKMQDAYDNELSNDDDDDDDDDDGGKKKKGGFGF